jgi:dolichyl-phosphate-mannose--protein O-mannosyl transferase
LSVWKIYTIRMFEILVSLVAGFILTEYVLRFIYESFGIHFIGNVWVNWFGVSYFLFFLYIVICELINVKKNNYLLKKRITSIFFLILFIGSVYVIFIPFVKGENPF